MKRITLIIIALFSTFSSATFAQIVNNDLFSIYSDEIHVLSDETYMFYREDGFIQLNQGNIISGLSISGNILLGELGFVRVVLESLSGNEYLVLETNSTFERDSIISFIEYCEETSLLDNVIPKRLIITISDASLTITEVLYSETSSYQKKIYDQIIGSQLDLKIEHINNSLSAKNAAWRAGKTFLSEMSYWEKKSVWGDPIPNLSGFDYYIGGIFTMPGYENSTPRNRDASQFVTEFDWRNRHGKNWITPIKEQGDCASCWAFSAIATFESYVNLYYNQLLNYDLSEQDILSCGNAGDCEGGGFLDTSFLYIKDYGVTDELCFNYTATDLSCQNKCTNPSERISIANYYTYNAPGTNTITPEDFKKKVIRAPISFGIDSWWHFISLIGFKTIQEGDVIYIKTWNDDYSITITADNPLIGQDAWIIKNSHGTSWGINGYGYVVTNWSEVYEINELSGNVTSLNLTINDIVCEDNDGDGFYFWGIGPKPSTCPACAPDEADGDDSNPDLGPMNEYGVCASTSQVENITTTQTWNNNRSLTNSISIQQGVTLTITCNINIAPKSKILIQPGGKLIIDGATLTGLCPDKMWDGIYVVGDTTKRQLAQYQGTLEVKNGSLIENAKNAIVTWDGSDYATSGGIVKCSNSTFRTNGKAIEFYPYTNHNSSGAETDNVNYAQKCTFVVDGNNLFASNNITFSEFVKISHVRGISFKGSSFRDGRATVSTTTKGIWSIGAGFNASEHCSTAYNSNAPCTCPAIETRTRFSRLGYGIYATNDGTTYNFTTDHAIFDTCYRAIQINAVNNCKITRSDFDQSAQGIFTSSAATGVYLYNSTGYTIEANSFATNYTTMPSGFQGRGVYVQGSGTDANTIYRNTITKLYHGIKSNGSNGGLQILCNVFSNSFYADIYVSGAFSSSQGQSSKSAGNIFTSGAYNLRNYSSNNVITYYHSGTSNSGNNFCPYNSLNTTFVANVTANNCASTICIPITPPPGPKSAPENDDITLYESLQQMYNARLTEYNAAGYGFLLENFDENDADIVAIARLKQDTLISLSRTMAEIAKRNLNAILADSVLDRESLNGWYNRINTQTAKYSLANSYFEIGEYALARQELAAIPQHFALSADELAEYDNFCDYNALRESVFTSGRNYAQLTEEEIAELEAIADLNTGVSSAYANSVLCFFYGICREIEESEIDDTPVTNKNAVATIEENETESLAVYVYPNPADEELNILLNSMPEGTTTIEFHDVTGRLVLSEEIKSANTSINISSLRQGVYMYRIVNGDNVIARDRIVKNK